MAKPWEKYQKALVPSSQSSGPWEKYRQGANENISPGLRLMNLLRLPEQKSREGLRMISSAIPKPEPTGNMAVDILRGTPRIAAETMAETAPSFVSPEALLFGAAGKALPYGVKAAAPVARFGGRAVAKAGRALSGVPEESFYQLYKNPGMFFAKGKSAAKKIYKEAVGKSGGNKPSNLDEALESSRKTVRRGMKVIDEGKATPMEALETRQALDEVIGGTKAPRKLVKLYEQRKKADAVVKSSPELAKADKISSKAEIMSRFRSLFPLNQNKTASTLRLLAQGSLGAVNPYLAPLFSPMAYGTGTAAAGGLSKGGQALMKILSKSPGRAGYTAGASINQRGKTRPVR